jgi:signal transduction histidine kinase
MRRPSGREVNSHTGTYPGDVRGVWTWLRSHPWETDLALAACIVLATRGQAGADPLILVVGVALAATLLARRKYPVQAFAVAVVIAVIQIYIGLWPGGSGYLVGAWQPSVADVTIAILLYTLAAHTSRRTSLIGFGVCLLLSAAAVARWGPAHTLGPAFAAGGAHTASPDSLALAGAALLCSVCLTAWVLGDTVAYRHRVAYLATLERRAARLEAERDAQALVAAAAERARELQERRALAVEDGAARLRRIERDLHDGAQVRLAALALTLGEIKENLEAAGQPDDDDQARTMTLIGAAHRNAKETLAELRDLARGIHPAALDRGLNAALGVLAESSAVPVTLTVTVTERPSAAIEAIAYFCAAELLANIAKHSNATEATVSAADSGGGLEMTVSDDGEGGARIVPGGGLHGLRERVQTVDGRLIVASPPGGPTTVMIRLPGHA